MRRAQCILVFLAMCLVAGPEGWAQGGHQGALNGRVIDASGSALPGVTVSASNEGTRDQRVTVTNAGGLYRLLALPVGSYTLTYQLEGFQTVSRPAVKAEAAVPTTINVMLQPAQVSETITVTAEAPVLQTTTATVSRQLTGVELIEIPSSTRNFTHLLTATAGVSSELPPVASNDNGSISPSVNGAKATSNSLRYNGVDVTSLLSNAGSLDENIVPAPETLEEVKLQTSLYDASTGRSGGGSFQLITRSGTNDVIGSAYSFAQDESFNSNDFFFDKAGIEKPRMRRLETGVTLGGPIKPDKLFFFGSVQYTDAETGYVPTASSRALVPAALGLIPGERTAENIVAAFKRLNPAFNLTASQISPLALALLNAINPRTGSYIIPTPNGAVIANDRRVAIGSFGTIGGDPLAELRQVIPAEFQQYQASLRVDSPLSEKNNLQASFFYTDFPSDDPFPDPSSLTSPFVLERTNRAAVASVVDTHIFTANLLSEATIGYFGLRNTRRLAEEFADLTGAQFGIVNPALLFDNRDATRRLGHFVNRAGTFSFGGPNDSYNRREQETLQLADTMSWLVGNHSVRFGGELKLNRVNTNLPEEQATEFEKIENWQQFLLGYTSEADTQFGFTEKEFESRDISLFVTDDWHVNHRLTLNAGLRWDWFGWPTEKNGFLGNFDPDRVTDPNNPITGLVVANNVRLTGVPQVDEAILAAPRTDSDHTLDGEDLDNFAPRVGFAYTPSDNSPWAFRGGYGIFYDRPSAAFMNTVFSNYPFLREIEITAPRTLVPIQDAFRTQIPAVAFNRYFPFNLTFANNAYTVFDGTGIGGTGNIAEALEFRAVDKDLETPFYHHYNLGVQYQLRNDMVVEVRYNGSRGENLLLATALNQPWDLNDPNTPAHILERITSAYRSGGGTGNSQDPDGLGYGYINPATGQADRNFGPGGRLIPTEVRTHYLGFNDAEFVYLQSVGESEYNGLQLSLTKRWSRGYQFHLAYTLSRSRDLFSADPGSTAGGGKPDVPNTGFVVENDSRNLEDNWADSDFDRRHRVSLSAVWSPQMGQGLLASDWKIGMYGQYQSGRPFSLYAFETGLFRLPFGRVDLAPGATLDEVRRGGSYERWFNVDAVRRASAMGNSPRNFLRGPDQKRVDLSISKGFPLARGYHAELRAEVFNAFDWVNYDMPENNIESEDFGRITRTVGGPRVWQFGARLTF